MNLSTAIRILAWSAVGLTAAFRPSFGDSFFRRIESLARRAAERPLLTCLAVGLVVLLFRVAMLPLWPIPKPFIFDEFSYLLQADTFAHGRLTNPAHPLWPFFESPFVLQHPTYASKYPPAQSLVIAAGQVLFGDPWFGVWLSCGMMAAALVWAMQGWLPPGWALYGGLLALPVSVVSYWMNSYWGGAVSAIGGALVLGGYARVVKRNQPVYAVAIGIGVAILANTRPYEGLVLAVPVGIALLVARRPRWSAIGLLAAVLIPAAAATLYYNRAVTGNAFLLPYTEYTRQYAHVPLFNFQPLQQARTDLTTSMYDLHQTWELAEWKKARSLQLIPMRILNWRDVAGTVLGSAVMGVLIVLFLPNLWRDRRIRLPLICVVAAVAGSLIETFHYIHYAGPAVAALFIVTVQAFRHLRRWKPNGQPVGRFLVRVLPVIVIGAAMVGQQGQKLFRNHPRPPNASRDQVAAMLSDQLERHVIVVRYTVQKNPHEEWVYNGADIDAQDIVWAHDLGPVENARLLEYYKDRKIWLYQPDIDVFRLDPYGAKP